MRFFLDMIFSSQLRVLSGNTLGGNYSVLLIHPEDFTSSDGKKTLGPAIARKPPKCGRLTLCRSDCARTTLFRYHSLFEPMKLSVIMPVYNERARSGLCWRKCFRWLDIELICVDDGSSDGSRSFCRIAAEHPEIRRLRSPGIWAGRRFKIAAFAEATGDFVVITGCRSRIRFPRSNTVLLEPLVEDRADVVYGSRFLRRGRIAYLFLAFVATGFHPAFQRSDKLT